MNHKLNRNYNFFFINGNVIAIIIFRKHNYKQFIIFRNIAQSPPKIIKSNLHKDYLNQFGLQFITFFFLMNAANILL